MFGKKEQEIPPEEQMVEEKLELICYYIKNLNPDLIPWVLERLLAKPVKNKSKRY